MASARAVRSRRARAGDARTGAPSHLKHIIRGGSPQTFDVLNRKWLVGPRRRDLSLPVLRPAQPRAERPVGASSSIPQTHAADRAASSPRRPRIAPTPADGDDRPWAGAAAAGRREFAGQGRRRQVSSRSPRRRCRSSRADYFVTEAPEPDRMNFGQLRSYIAELQGQRLRRARTRGRAATASSPFRS